MKTTTATLLLSTLGLALSSAAFANENEASGIVPQYGENPNIAHVLAYKAQEKVVGAAQSVGQATEKGIAKIKPGVDQAWENTKNLTSRGSKQVKESSQQVAANVNDKVQQAKTAVQPRGQAAPIIETQSLSQSNSAQPQSNTSSHSGATTYAITDL